MWVMQTMENGSECGRSIMCTPDDGRIYFKKKIGCERGWYSRVPRLLVLVSSSFLL